MLDFRTPALSDRGRIESFLRCCGQIDCDTSFSNTYLWRKDYDIRVAFDGDSFYKAYFRNGLPMAYTLPATKGELRKAVDTVIKDAGERGIEPRMGFLSSANAELISCIYGDKVSIKEVRDSFDYIYKRENLANLSGKKYHAKRNHISKFIRNHTDYSVKELCADNFADAFSVDNFDAIGLFGLVLYVDSKPVSMCIASEINDCVCDVNIEKAVDIDEAFAVINNEFAKYFDKYTLINREDDMGLEGLRKSKLSYHPDILYSKSIAEFKL